MINLSRKEYCGIIKAPSSKSDGHRALIAASLVENGISEITNVYFSDDIKATISCLESLGAQFTISDSTVLVKGINFYNSYTTLHCNESGSTLRFLIPLASNFSQVATFITNGKLSSRPLDIYNSFLNIKKENNNIIVKGKFTGGTYTLDGSISSQFISGLLFLLPLLEEDSIIEINNTISSLSYILMTIETLKKFNISINFDTANKKIYIKGKQKYKATKYDVENDYSQASFFLALGAISEKPITVSGLNENSFQADKNIIPILKQLGVKIDINGDSITTYKSSLNKTTISLDENPDLGPILMGLAAYAKEDVTFTNIARLRIKESDRIEAMKYNLDQLGVDLEIIDDNTCIVHPNKLTEPKNTLLSFNDHRIFITLAIICHNMNISIDNEQCINKSYPTFLEDLKSLEKRCLHE